MAKQGFESLTPSQASTLLTLLKAAKDDEDVVRLKYAVEHGLEIIVAVQRALHEKYPRQYAIALQKNQMWAGELL